MTGKGTEQPNPECCMCGDLGFSVQLFQCRVCQFRSQHRYCSNIYPKAEPYGTCNWCLIRKEGSKEKSPNSSNSSSSYKNNGSPNNESKNKKLRNGNKGLRQSTLLQLQLENKPIKKPRASPEAATSPSSITVSTRKRIVTNGALEERLMRTKSEDITNITSSRVTRQVFRNKVRRYKLLDEVSS